MGPIVPERICCFQPIRTSILDLSTCSATEDDFQMLVLGDYHEIDFPPQTCCLLVKHLVLLDIANLPRILTCDDHHLYTTGSTFQWEEASR
jgi:hypothetical protein